MAFLIISSKIMKKPEGDKPVHFLLVLHGLKWNIGISDIRFLHGLNWKIQNSWQKVQNESCEHL